ncbi:unnamed protein product [Mytilus edulis]|uniref:Uncharacterized protein n=1 Tax=Mytilus edulis TaxID=6550 RepID=A0A8S3TAL2_MYTED|nr:unnamed protein product [Mytilus edulis]
MRNLQAPTGQVARWLQELGTYDLTVVHRPGLKHRNADAPNPCASCSRQESVNNAHDSCDEDSEEKEQLSVRTVTRSKVDTSPTRNQFVLLGWDANTIRQQQLQDKIIGQLFIKFEDKETKPEWNSLSDESSDLKPYGNMGTDCFSKWTDAYGIPDQEAATVAKIFVNEFLFVNLYPLADPYRSRQILSPKFSRECELACIDKPDQHHFIHSLMAVLKGLTVLNKYVEYVLCKKTKLFGMNICLKFYLPTDHQFIQPLDLHPIS